jgi:hypothetical protein
MGAQLRGGFSRCFGAAEPGRAHSIAEGIRINVSPSEQTELKSVKVVNPQAYESYLKGRFFWNKRTADGLKVA